ncbi:PAQR family membrane homeostasis protein TrhA [Streptococcus entericus]|uniref:PAQR family membrane homeostasis protein TrhA n=1 Tax=Streptococcus entericus TaxID=155680 RepID=UPI000363D0AE|nr:hemolysin III family protein [Streptococcus entericus]
MNLSQRLTFGEELANAISHGVMFLLLLGLSPWMAVHTYLKGGVTLAFGASVFIVALSLMFLSSTLYHSMAYDSPHKRVFRILDHSSIFIAIAGSYTPVLLMALEKWQSWLMVGLQWFLVIGGILYKVLGKNRIPKLSLIIYLVMGWQAVFFLPQIIRATNAVFLSLIVAGGLMYTIGAYFYSKKNMPYHHLIWHLFINAASICHIIAIVGYL